MSQVEMLFALAGFCAAVAAFEFAMASAYTNPVGKMVAGGMGAVIAALAVVFLVTGVIVLMFP